MGKIIYQKGSIFDYKEPCMYLHACNAQGVWLSGIAHEFAERYPYAYEEYKGYCRITKKLPGHSLIARDGDQQIACLITSEKYGQLKDPVEKILFQTAWALNDLAPYLPPGTVIVSPKINAGLFCVPWEKTEMIIEKFLERQPDITWIVRTLYDI